MKKFYYDTSSFWEFFERQYLNIQKRIEYNIPDVISIYSPLNLEKNIVRITAPWTLDELFHRYIQKKEKEIKTTTFNSCDILKKIQDLALMKGFLAFFTQESINSRDINELFLTLFELAKNNDILYLKKGDNKLNSKDLLHLAYALISRCNIFLTSDNDYLLVSNVERIVKILQYYKMEKIVILANDLKSIKKEKNYDI